MDNQDVNEMKQCPDCCMLVPVIESEKGLTRALYGAGLDKED